MLESLRANPPNFPVDVLQDLHIAICRLEKMATCVKSGWPPEGSPALSPRRSPSRAPVAVLLRHAWV